MRIALSGKMGSGKSSVLKELGKFYSYEGISIGNEIKPLATSLIEDRESFEEQIKQVIPDKHQRVSSLREIYQFFDDNFQGAKWLKDSSGVFVKNTAYRRLLQDFPMLVRNHFGEEIFASLMIERLPIEVSRDSYTVCDDLRLSNEKKLLEESGFLIIRFDISEKEQERRLKETYGTYDKSALKHRTEVALDDAIFDLRIDVSHKTVSEIAKEIQEYLGSINRARV